MSQYLVSDEAEAEDTQKGKYLTFQLEQVFYGIEIKNVTEIIGIQNITEVPEMPDFIRGIINLRGNIIPVMDVRLRFKKDFREYNDRTCIIVIDIMDISIGLIVDSVSEVLTIPEEGINPPPEVHNISSRYIKAIGKVDQNVKLILDCEKLLNDVEVEDLSAVMMSN
ncbi:MAG: chemotaxis protein CheW [Candidatus Cohnella colombiensis]|uniref:Chemotaxis protein CheW n=1 Tax=Candidatus Cohnella colombiensis TaxID=3121368 RepID=A0AA95JBZ8_9BACL|nr:MAG: chemotaxis protein CheW [Cohnella sp.]